MNNILDLVLEDRIERDNFGLYTGLPTVTVDQGGDAPDIEYMSVFRRKVSPFWCFWNSLDQKKYELLFL